MTIFSFNVFFLNNYFLTTFFFIYVFFAIKRQTVACKKQLTKAVISSACSSWRSHRPSRCCACSAPAACCSPPCPRSPAAPPPPRWSSSAAPAPPSLLSFPARSHSRASRCPPLGMGMFSLFVWFIFICSNYNIQNCQIALRYVIY